MRPSSEAFAPLGMPAFRWFFAARLVSTAGSAMAPVALVFAVLHITDSASALGQVLAARSIPLVLFLLIGGVICDRFPRRTVLIVAHVLSALTQSAAAVLVITGQAELWHLVVLEALNGATTAFTMPAILGMVPQLVDRAHLQQANALLAFSRSGMAILGPSVAALLVVTVGPGWALLADSLTWLVAAILMVPIRVVEPAAGRGGSLSLLSELRSGWSVFIGATWLWVVVLACGILNAIHAGAWNTLGPLAALQLPAIGERGWGLALSAEAIGLLLVTLVMLRAKIVHPLRWGVPAMTLLALPLLALGAAADLWVLVAAAFLAGAGVQVFMVTWQTAIQENIPERYLSRVSAYDSIGSFAAIPLGQLAVGPIAAGGDVTGVIWWAGWVFVVVLAITLAVPAVRNLRRPSQASSTDGKGTAGEGPAPDPSAPAVDHRGARRDRSRARARSVGRERDVARDHAAHERAEREQAAGLGGVGNRRGVPDAGPEGGRSESAATTRLRRLMRHASDQRRNTVAVKDIRLFGDPVLRTPAAPVVDFDKELRRLVADLTDTMRDAPGAGLAAPQIGVGLRVFTWWVDDELGHLCNPVLDLSDEMQDGEEGCLSFPGIYYDTPRAMRVVAKGMSMHGEPVTIEGSELLARCIQHETDHLDGILFIDRMDKAQRRLAMKAIREAEWAGGPTPTVKLSPHSTFGRGL